MAKTALARLEEMEAKAREGGGPERIEKQHARGKMTARERLDALLDPGTFVELDAFATHRATEFGMERKRPLGDGVVTGWGEIDGRLVYVFAQDFTVLGGSVGEAHGRKICKVLDLALQNGAPVIGLNDSGGARIQEGVDALAAYGEVFYRNVLASGVVPQISVIMGPCAGGAVYSPALTDFVVMVEGTARMFITGPDVVRAVTHEEVTSEDLGGAEVHHTTSGVAHFTAADDMEALALVRSLLSYLPSNNAEDPPYIPPTDPPGRTDPDLDHLVPEDPKQGYDMREVIHRVVDEGSFLEVQKGFAPNLIVGFARLGGSVVGIVAQQPAVLAGVLDINASDKGTRFIRFCDCFNIPIITFVDTPGFLPGVAQEHNGIIRHGAKMIYAYAEAIVPKISVITRKAYGGAYIVMSSKHLRSDICLAWPDAEIAVMGPEGAVKVVFRRDLEQAEDPKATQERLVEEYRERFANPYVAAARGYLDAVIRPSQTRPFLIRGLRMLRDKRVRRPPRKHGNMPV
ncbi:MAG TPA: acyl-CoA carboxylase subunit beta [Thermoflexia bacterium]|jgi:acetyl-CoA carboxylase carboxyltransferase component|nr:acyl-CoA carboxylase subunit beta [Thermoflexia bacterium]